MKYFSSIITSAILIAGTVNAAIKVERSFVPALTAIG
jgi:hypothetical protein